MIEACRPVYQPGNPDEIRPVQRGGVIDEVDPGPPNPSSPPEGCRPALNVLPWDSELPGWASTYLEQIAEVPGMLGLGGGAP